MHSKNYANAGNVDAWLNNNIEPWEIKRTKGGSALLIDGLSIRGSLRIDGIRSSFIDGNSLGFNMTPEELLSRMTEAGFGAQINTESTSE